MQYCAIICKQNQKRISGSFEANTRLQLQNTKQSKQMKNADKRMNLISELKAKAQIDKLDLLESRNRIIGWSMYACLACPGEIFLNLYSFSPPAGRLRSLPTRARGIFRSP